MTIITHIYSFEEKVTHHNIVEECKKKADNDDGKSKSSKKKGCLQMAKYCINEEDFKHLAKGTR